MSIKTVPLRCLQASELQTRRLLVLVKAMTKELQKARGDDVRELLDRAEAIVTGKDTTPFSQRLSWSTDKPTKSGWYWYLDETLDQPMVLEIDTYQYEPKSRSFLSVWQRGRSTWLSSWHKNGVWVGPIATPVEEYQANNYAPEAQGELS